MSYTAFVHELKSQMERTPGIANVRIGRKRVDQPEDLRQEYLERLPNGKDRLHFWEINRVSLAAQTGASTRNAPISEFRWVHNFTIEGYFSISANDNSEEAFQELLQSLIRAILPYKHHSGMEYINEPQCTSITYRDFGPARCHYCLITLQALQREVVHWEA